MIFYPSLMVVIIVIAGLSLIKVKPAARSADDEQIIYELLEDDNECEKDD